MVERVAALFVATRTLTLPDPLPLPSPDGNFSPPTEYARARGV